MRVSAAALLLLFAPCLQAAQVSITDSFDGKSGVAWMAQKGDWQPRGGVYHASGSGETYLQGMTFRDVDVEVDCRISDYGAIVADWMGVAVGADEQSGVGLGYMAYLRYSGQVELYREGQILAARPTGAQAKFAAGQFVRLGVSVHGMHITVRVDGQSLIEYDAPSEIVGMVGLLTYDVQADYANFRLQGDRFQNMITGQVLALPSYTPVPGARVEIYNSMDGYNSPVTRQTVSDAAGRYVFTDLPSGERAYWLRAGKEGCGGTTAWFVSVTDTGPTTADLCLIGAPRHDIWIDSAAARDCSFRKVEDPQCFGGSRLEIKEERPGNTHPEWSATFDFQTPHEADYVPHFAAGQYPTIYYWSDFWWSVDGRGPFRASETLKLEGDRYGDRSTLVWSYGPAMHLKAGKHILKVLLRDPTANPPGKDGKRAYAWSFNAAAFAEAPVLVSPTRGQTVTTARPQLRWQGGAARYAVQFSQEPDFSNATVTVGGVRDTSLTPASDLADGVYYWRIKPQTEEETSFSSAFTAPQRFVVATGAPAISTVRVLSRKPTEAVIAWETDAPCTSRLRYGLSALGCNRAVEASAKPTTRHQARLAGLEPMTYYYYIPEATNKAGRTSAGLRRGLCTPRGIIADRNSPFGIFGQGLVYADKLGKAGAKWYSDYWDWGTVEPSRGKFDWQQPEQRMKRAADAGVNLLVTFWGTPAWVRPSHPTKFTYGPDDLQDARDFFREVAGHCKGRSTWWLPWIEPNVARDTTFGFPEGYWAGRPHARSLAAYQRAAYQGAKAGDPDCRFVGMNTAGVDLDFIRKCYDEGAADDFDVMNVHYYAIGEPFERQDPEALFRSLRALMSEYGDGEKPILCSEGGGASSGVPGTDESSQADNIVRIFVLTIANNIDKLCWTFELDEKPYGSKHVDMIMWMGLFRFDPRVTPDNPIGEPKPSYFAFQTMTQALTGTEYAGPVSLGPGIRAYRFEGPKQRVTVAWAEKDKATVKLPVATIQVTVTDCRGNARKLAARDGSIVLRLTGSPVFVREER
jgi:hypothetical protein